MTDAAPSVVPDDEPIASDDAAGGSLPSSDAKGARLSPGRRLLKRYGMTAAFSTALLVGVVFLWRGGQLGDTWAALKDADPRVLIAGGVLYLVGLAILCLRWHLLLVVVHGRSHLAIASEAFISSVAIKYMAPGGLAVPIRAALTKRALNLTMTETTAVALWELGADLLILAVGSAIWIALGGYRSDVVRDHSATILPLAAAAVVAGLAALAAVWRLRPALVAKVWRKLDEMVRLPANDPRTAVVILAISVAYWVMQGATIALMLEAVGVDPSWLLALGLTSLPILIGMVSPIPGGGGVREALMTAVASLHGAAAGPVVVAAVIYRVALFASIPVLYVVVQLWLRGPRKAAAEATLTAEGSP